MKKVLMNKRNYWEIIIIFISFLFIILLSLKKIENLLLIITETDDWLHGKLQFLFERKINLIPLLIIPISFFIQLLLKTIISQYENRILLSIPLVLFSSFVLCNVIILMCDSFLGIGCLWDLGDFCNVETINGYTTGRLYEKNYPPVATLIYYITQKIVKIDSAETVSYGLNYLSFLFYFFNSFSIFFLCENVLSNKSYCKLISFSLIISYPMIFAFERANIILFSLVLSFVFVNNYNSEKKFLRLISIICLALAVNIKIYPIVFAWFLFKEKRYKDLFLTLFMCLLFFVFPAFLLKIFIGESVIGNIKLYIDSITQFSVSNSGYTVSIRNIIERVIHYYLGKDLDNVITIISSGTLIIYIVWSFVLLVFSEKFSNTLLVLSLMIIFVPDVSYWYSLIFLIIPFVYLLKETISEKTSDYALLLLYISLFLLMHHNTFFVDNTFVRLICLLFLVSYRVINEKYKKNN